MSDGKALFDAVVSRDKALIRKLVESGVDINGRFDDGASVLFAACLEGDARVVQLLLDLGADPNLVADEPAADMYARNPLELVMQTQHLIDWNKYTPIFELLVTYGATEMGLTVRSLEDEQERKHRALEWQAGRNRGRGSGT